MNEQNVSALTQHIKDAAMLTGARAALVADAERIARFLADRGCLVPSVLSDDDCRDLPAFYPETSTVAPEQVWAELRSALANIAKGEQ